MGDHRTVIDQMGREITFSFPPQKIISLVPSQTEFLVEISAQVIGRTKFCIHPKDQTPSIQIVGGTKNLRFDTIQKLNPDLIIGNKEENKEKDIVQLSKDFPVWMSDIYSLEDAYQMMKSLGQIFELQKEGDRIISACQSSMERVRNSRSGKVVYLIWKNPWMAAGRNTFIDHMLSHLGFENVVSDPRYPELTEEAVKNLNPDYIFFSSEPFPFNKSHVDDAKIIWRESTCELVDGELYSWYGSRLKYWA